MKNKTEEGHNPWKRKRGVFRDIWWYISSRFYRIQMLYWNIKYFITKILFGGYIKPFTQLVRYDYHSVLEFQKFQIEKLLEDVKNGMECDEGRIPKEKDMARVIYLIDNILKDDFMERCGYDYNRCEFRWFKHKDDKDLVELKDVHPNQYSTKEYRKISDKALELQEAESKELYKILHENSLGWWD